MLTLFWNMLQPEDLRMPQLYRFDSYTSVKSADSWKQTVMQLLRDGKMSLIELSFSADRLNRIVVIE